MRAASAEAQRPLASATLPAPPPSPLDPRRTRPRIHDCMLAAAHGFGVDLAVIASARRDRRATTARQVGMYLAAQLSGHTLSVIGRTIARHNDCIRLGEARVIERMATDAEFAARVQALVAALTNPSPRTAE